MIDKRIEFSDEIIQIFCKTRQIDAVVIKTWYVGVGDNGRDIIGDKIIMQCVNVNTKTQPYDNQKVFDHRHFVYLILIHPTPSPSLLFKAKPSRNGTAWPKKGLALFEHYQGSTSICCFCLTFILIFDKAHFYAIFGHEVNLMKYYFI